MFAKLLNKTIGKRINKWYWAETKKPDFNPNTAGMGDWFIFSWYCGGSDIWWINIKYFWYLGHKVGEKTVTWGFSNPIKERRKALLVRKVLKQLRKEGKL